MISISTNIAYNIDSYDSCVVDKSGINELWCNPFIGIPLGLIFLFFISLGLLTCLYLLTQTKPVVVLEPEGIWFNKFEQKIPWKFIVSITQEKNSVVFNLNDDIYNITQIKIDRPKSSNFISISPDHKRILLLTNALDFNISKKIVQFHNSNGLGTEKIKQIIN
jgi:(2Fe-2S) ferredoxin